MTKCTTKIIFVLSIFGVLLSTYSLLHNQGFASGEFCVYGEVINCDIVNKGPFSQIAGIPVSLIGIVGYMFLAVGSWMLLHNFDDKSLKWFLFLAACVGLIFSLYLTSLEAFVLHAWCLVCLVSQVLILTITGLCAYLFLARQRK